MRRNKKKLGSHSDRCVSRVYGEPLDIIPPKPLPQWMVAPEFQHHSESPCSQESSDPSTPVGSGTLPSAQRPTNTDSLYGPMYTPSSIDTVYVPTMLLHLIFTVICNNFIQLLDKMRKLQFVQIRIIFGERERANLVVSTADFSLYIFIYIYIYIYLYLYISGAGRHHTVMLYVILNTRTNVKFHKSSTKFHVFEARLFGCS